MKTFLILTEDKNRDKIEFAASRRFSGWTILEGKGFWLGQSKTYKENSLVILVVNPREKRLITEFAESIKKINDQESVLVIQWDTESEFV